MAEQPLPTTDMVRYAYISWHDGGNAQSRDHFRAKFDAWLAEHDKQVLAAPEPDLGDGTAPPEENFWDDRTTPLAYGREDSERDLAKRREFAAYVLERAAKALPPMVVQTFGARRWLNDRAKKIRAGKL